MDLIKIKKFKVGFINSKNKLIWWKINKKIKLFKILQK